MAKQPQQFADRRVYCKVQRVSSFALAQRLDASLPTLPKERGPAEALPGRNAEAERVRERISEGFRLAEPGRVVPGGREAPRPLWIRGGEQRKELLLEFRQAIDNSQPHLLSHLHLHHLGRQALTNPMGIL